MTTSQKPIFRFLSFLTGTLLLAFVVHVLVLEKLELPKYDHLIVLSYLVNGILAAAIYCILYIFRVRLKNQIGFLFIAGSLLKFIVFFLLFYPSYTNDGDIQKTEFAAFFIPYSISLVLETFFMGKMLNKMD